MGYSVDWSEWKYSEMFFLQILQTNVLFFLLDLFFIYLWDLDDFRYCHNQSAHHPDEHFNREIIRIIIVSKN